MVEQNAPRDTLNGPTIDDQFCPLCDVVLDLHDGPDTCRSAEMKADLLNRFWTLLGGVV